MQIGARWTRSNEVLRGVEGLYGVRNTSERATRQGSGGTIHGRWGLQHIGFLSGMTFSSLDISLDSLFFFSTSCATLGNRWTGIFAMLFLFYFPFRILWFPNLRVFCSDSWRTNTMDSIFSRLLRGGPTPDIATTVVRRFPFPLTLPWHRCDWLRVVENYTAGTPHGG